MNILFICTGNTCRSPMAHYYLNSLNLNGVNAFSAGLFADGSPISENSRLALSEAGIDAGSHLSHTVTLEDVKKADKIYCMTPSHKATLISAGIEKEKLFLLSDKGISDPFGQDLNAYRKCRDEIFSSIDEIFKNEMPKAEYLTEKDAEEIAFIEKECFADPWSVKSILDSIKGNNVFIGIKENGSLIGYLSLYESLDEGYINNIAVLKDKRRKGIGKSLLKEITHYAVSKGLSFISLEVRVSNTPAINLYSSFGFKEEGKRKNYYNNPTEDAIILTRRF